jgi:hypothetical protein
MPDFFKALYRWLYNLWRPIPSNDKIAEILKSVPIGRENETAPQIAGDSKAPQQVCLISFSMGDHDICVPTIHDVTGCEMAAALINKQSGRNDAVGNIIDGPCPAGSSLIRPAS